MKAKFFATVPVTLTPAAEEVLAANQGEAPSSEVRRACLECSTRGWVRVRVTMDGMEVEAPCRHLGALYGGRARGQTAYEVWGGRPGYSVLPLAVAGRMGWRFAQAEPEFIHVLGRVGEIYLGIALRDEAEGLALSRPNHLACGAEWPLPDDMLRFFGERLRVAVPERPGLPAVWRAADEIDGR